VAFVQLTGVSLAFGDRDVLRNCSFFLKSGSKTALTGANGAGKSTLLKIAAGITAPDAGARALEKEARIAYLPQAGLVHRGRTLTAEADSAFDPIANQLKQADAIGAQLAAIPPDDPNVTTLTLEHHHILESVENSGYYTRDKTIEEVLSGLGFHRSDFDKPTEQFSGGWQMRIALAKLLLSAPDIMLLDEPTNYLDIEARGWLENYLSSFKGAYMLVSHDRYFLDVTVNEIYELFQGKLSRYSGNYTAYQAKREVELASLVARYKLQQEEIAKSEDIIRRFRYKATKAAMVQERIKRLDKMERIEIPESLKKIDIVLPAPPHTGRLVLQVENVSKRYGDTPVLDNITLTIEQRERLAVVGENGAGKSTLLRILAGADNNYDGSVHLGAGVIPAYFTQDETDRVVGPESALEFLEHDAPTALIPHLRDMLGAFLFRGDDVYKKLDVLSGGEKSRLALLRLLLRPVNLLILDEPTNHLDLQSQDILLSALAKWDGTVVFVSHDRSFMEALSTQTVELKDGAHSRLFYGNYAYYCDRVAQEAATASPQRPAMPSPAKVSAQQQRAARKAADAAARKRAREEAAILDEIADCEARKAALEASLSTREVYSSATKARATQADIAALTREIDDLTAKWEKFAR
jgi:ATP-binding cassette subfamily F protein 3